MRPLATSGYPVLGALLFGLGYAVIGSVHSPLQFDFATDPPPAVMTGVYPVERAPDGVTYAWTRTNFGIKLAGLDRSIPWRITLTLRAARPDGTEPDLTVSIDGAVKTRTKVPAGFVDQVIAVAPDPRVTTTQLGFSVSPGFTPPNDPRELGLLIDRLRVEPERWSMRVPPFRAFLAGLCLGALLLVLALPGPVGLPIALFAAVLFGVITTGGFAPFTLFPSPWLLLFAGLSALAASAVLLRLNPPSTGARTIVAITFVASYLKLLLLWHPDMPLGDAVFHAHRFQDVLAGKYFFTSLAPGNYRFPYPIGLYLFARPLARFTRSAVENAALLRTVVVCVDAFAASLLYVLIRRWRSDEIGGVAAVVTYHWLPLSFLVIATANLTNIFAQSLATMTLVAVAVIGAATTSTLLITALASAAFLSHTSTFAVLGAQLGLTGLALLMYPGPRRRAGFIVLSATGLALAVAVVLYYGHFLEVYREALPRAAAETGRATEAAGGRTPLMRLIDVPRLIGGNIGWPAVLLAAVGALSVRRGPSTPDVGASTSGVDTRSPVPVAVGIFLLACLMFLGIGILTPIDLRHFLAALPMIAVLAGLGFSNAWQARDGLRIGAILVAVWLASVGIASWFLPSP